MNLFTQKTLPDGNIRFTARTRLIGVTLFASKISQEISFEMTPQQQQDACNRILQASNCTTEFVAVAVRCSTGSLILDCDLATDLAATIMCNNIESELGDLMNLYPPKKK